nr:hypothetical protein [uncultured Lacibacter sp.]
MKNYILILWATVVSSVISAQKIKYNTVQAGQSLIEAVPVSKTYEYAAFREGTVNFKAGTSSSAETGFGK